MAHIATNYLSHKDRSYDTPPIIASREIPPAAIPIAPPFLDEGSDAHTFEHR